MGSGLIALGTTSMFANKALMETVGHNISNANTEGYSRQDVKLTTQSGRFTGAGFYGNGVRVATVSRTTDSYLTREANLTMSTASADKARLDKLGQLEKVFPLGEEGIGYASGQLINAFVEVASQPQDMSGRQVALGRAENVASRMRSAADQLSNLQDGVVEDLHNSVARVNGITKQIANINQQIASVKGIGHEPNDLLDQREMLIKSLNEFIQVSTIEADDGTVGVFIGGGQRLVLGITTENLSLSLDEFDLTKRNLTVSNSGNQRKVNENLVMGGSIAGLLQVQNEDIPLGRNLLGQMATALSWRINQQQALGLDLGTPPGSGAPIFNTGALQVLPSTRNTSSLSTPPVTLSVVDGRELQASDYTFNPDPLTPGQFTLTRLSDGEVTSVVDGDTVDGFQINISGPIPNTDSFLLRPVGTGAAMMSRVLTQPSGIAAASLFTATTKASNTGSASVSALAMASTPNAALSPLNGTPVNIVFTSATGDYELQAPLGTMLAAGTWTPGQPISYNGFELKLNGVAGNGDVIQVSNTAFPAGSNGNALALLALRDEDLVGRTNLGGGVTGPGTTITSAYSQIIGNIGVRVQEAKTSSTISNVLAADAAQLLSNKVGVNLDEEAARLIQYQQSYQAAAKILQVAQTVFETLLDTAR